MTNAAFAILCLLLVLAIGACAMVSIEFGIGFGLVAAASICWARDW